MTNTLCPRGVWNHHTGCSCVPNSTATEATGVDLFDNPETLHGLDAFATDLDEETELDDNNDGRYDGYGHETFADAESEAEEDAVDPQWVRSISWDDDAEIKELLDYSTSVARKYAASRGTANNAMEVDDLTQEALLAVLKRREKGDFESIENAFGYVNHAARNIASRAGRSVSSPDLGAMRMYKTWHEEYMATNNCEPSSAECDAAAADIRDKWRPQSWDGVSKVERRPSVNFRENVQGWERTRTNGMSEELFDRVVSINGHDAASNYVEPGSALDIALAHVEDTDEDHKATGSRRAGRRLVWNAVAEGFGAPSIAPHLGHRGVTDAYRVIGSEEAFEKAIDAWQDGADNQATKALMSPWIGAESDEQGDVVRMFNEHPDYAYDLWKSAVTAAAKPRKATASAAPVAVGA